MFIGLLTIEMDIPGATSLKDKRQVIRSVQSRLRNKFNVSVAEVDRQDAAQTTVIAVVCVSSDKAYAQGLLAKAANWVENARLDCVLVDYQIEFV